MLLYRAIRYSAREGAFNNFPERATVVLHVVEQLLKFGTVVYAKFFYRAGEQELMVINMFSITFQSG